MRVLHIDSEQFALEEHTLPAQYSGVNIWTAKHHWLAQPDPDVCASREAKTAPPGIDV